MNQTRWIHLESDAFFLCSLERDSHPVPTSGSLVRDSLPVPTSGSLVRDSHPVPKSGGIPFPPHSSCLRRVTDSLTLAARLVGDSIYVRSLERDSDPVTPPPLPERESPLVPYMSRTSAPVAWAMPTRMARTTRHSKNVFDDFDGLVGMAHRTIESNAARHIPAL